MLLCESGISSVKGLAGHSKRTDHEGCGLEKMLSEGWKERVLLLFTHVCK